MGMKQARVTKLRQAMREKGMEALLITNSHNRRYLTGFTGTAGYVAVTGDRCWLFVDFRYTEQAKEQAPAFFDIVEHAAKPMDTIRETLKASGVRSLGFEQNDVTYASYTGYVRELEGLTLVPADPLVERLRMIKDEGELAVMREAGDLADRTFRHIVSLIKPGMTETDVALEMEFYMRSHGATSSSFDTIVASGERSALPHGVASGRVIGKDEFVKLDFGAYYKGYCSDLTRTVVVGTPTDRHRELYRIVLEAQEEALARIRPGMTGREADAIARDIIARHGYGDRFGHGLGHGLGMQIHEAPRLSPSGDLVLEPGMTVTVEPGIYLPGFGGVRIEDDVVVTENGVERLTHASKEFLCI